MESFGNTDSQCWQNAIDNESIGILQKYNMLTSLFDPFVDMSLSVQQMVNISMTVWFGLDGPPIIAIETKPSINIPQSRNLILTNQMYLIILESKIVILLQEFARQGIGITRGHDDERQTNVLPSRTLDGHPLHGQNVFAIYLKVTFVGDEIGFQSELDSGIPQPFSQSSCHQNKRHVCNARQSLLLGLREGHTGMRVGYGRIVG
mmetsp:Transcript_16288/g.23204  ORF Transcript_16288/g.23204 Transcript_16288/m.23204 type:complete len:205 (+) Transcript_16288:1124-1738(+)